jgi:putative colanic acid biosynthesis UDP-glucose lipid carrier transferase
VYLTLSPQTEQKIQSLLKELADSMVSVYFVPDIFLLDLMLGGSIIFFENLPVISFRETPIRGINAFLKRIEDLVVAGFILLIASPLLLAIAVGVKLTSQGPVIFKQWRYGLNGRPIQVYKFRTMNVNEDGYDFTQATKDDSRITPFGAFLRQTSLDELPQLINVIQGRMSLVGPRPHPVAMNEQYRKSVPGYMLRHKVKPGLTGLAQIKGFRGETDTLEKIERRVEYDLEYLRQWSLVMDLEILLRTILTGAWRTNAY